MSFQKMTVDVGKVVVLATIKGEVSLTLYFCFHHYIFLFLTLLFYSKYWARLYSLPWLVILRFILCNDRDKLQEAKLQELVYLKGVVILISES